MKTKFLIVVLVSLVVISVASASMLIPANDKAKEKAKAPEKSPVIGENWDLERIDFIHYARPDNPGKPNKPGKTETCYKLLGVKWKSLPVNYVINPTNPDDLTEDFVTSAISASAETWNNATTSELFNNKYVVDYNVNYGQQDFVNVVSFGDYQEKGVIGITTIWYIPRGKKIVEFDILLDTDYSWGDATNPETPTVMDLQNIATHELGHSVGLNDIYSQSCSEVTMYGYSDYGETNKRTLENPDIAGIQQLYG